MEERNPRPMAGEKGDSFLCEFPFLSLFCFLHIAEPLWVNELVWFLHGRERLLLCWTQCTVSQLVPPCVYLCPGYLLCAERVGHESERRWFCKHLYHISKCAGRLQKERQRENGSAGPATKLGVPGNYPDR